MDVVTILDVLAHVSRPLDLVRSALSRLRSHGLLMIKSPARPQVLVGAEGVLSFVVGTDRSPFLHRYSQVYMFDRSSVAAALRSWDLDRVQTRRWPEVFALDTGVVDVGAQLLQRCFSGRGSILGWGWKT